MLGQNGPVAMPMKKSRIWLYPRYIKIYENEQ